jgi:hypothetical protein
VFQQLFRSVDGDLLRLAGAVAIRDQQVLQGEAGFAKKHGNALVETPADSFYDSLICLGHESKG